MKNRAGGYTLLRSEYLQKWLREAYPAYNLIVLSNPKQWIKSVEIIQFLWETGSIPTEPGWTVLVLITKLIADTCMILLIEVVWKVAEAVTDIQIKSVVQFHDVFHGFCACRGTRTNIMELKVLQELEIVDQDPLLLLFLDLRKA